MYGPSHRSVGRKSVFFTLAGVALITVLLLSGLPAAHARSVVGTAGSSFKSTFTSNTAGWAVVSGTWKKTGSGYYQGIPSGLSVFNSVVHNDTYTDFSLTTRVRRPSGNGPNMLFVRGNPSPLSTSNLWDDGYVFAWGNPGYVTVGIFFNGAGAPLMDSTSSAIIPYGWNVVRVDMTGTYMAFFINNQLVFAISDASLPSGQVGLGFWPDASTDKLNIDYVKLKVVTP